MAAKYVVQMYEHYPIYEPVEGGYYYSGMEPSSYEKYVTKQDAIEALQGIVLEENEFLSETDEGFIVINPCGKHALSINHKYIGEGIEFYVEPINRRGRAKRGWEPYQ